MLQWMIFSSTSSKCSDLMDITSYGKFLQVSSMQFFLPVILEHLLFYQID